MDRIKSLLIFTNPQKVLYFFLDHPGEELTEKEVRNNTKTSRAGANYALKELTKIDLLFKNKRGNMSFYSLNHRDCLIKQLKVLKIILCIQPLVKRLEAFSSQITLFGSCARGEDVIDSDIDIFVISDYKKEELEKEIKKSKLKRKIQLIVETELSHTELKVKDPDFYDQIQRGIVLWKRI